MDITPFHIEGKEMQYKIGPTEILPGMDEEQYIVIVGGRHLILKNSFGTGAMITLSNSDREVIGRTIQEVLDGKRNYNNRHLYPTLNVEYYSHGPLSGVRIEINSYREDHTWVSVAISNDSARVLLQQLTKRILDTVMEPIDITPIIRALDALVNAAMRKEKEYLTSINSDNEEYAQHLYSQIWVPYWDIASQIPFEYRVEYCDFDSSYKDDILAHYNAYKHVLPDKVEVVEDENKWWKDALVEVNYHNLTGVHYYNR